MESETVIENFEKILKKNQTKQSPSLYSDIKTSIKPTNRPQEVIKIVSAQIRAIQMADRVRKKLETPVLTHEKLAVYDKAKIKLGNKFETQCVSDTQLIDIVKVAEAFDADLVEDLDGSVTASDLEKINQGIRIEEGNEDRNNIRKEIFNDKIKESADGNIAIGKCLIKNTEEITELHKLPEEKGINKDIITKVDTENLTDNIAGIQTFVGFTEDFVESDKDIFEENDDTDFDVLEINKCVSLSPILNKIEPIKAVSKEKLRDRDKERSISPILNGYVIKNKSPSPLVFNLDSFERFEQVAIPLIEENLDLNMAKHLINSQILDKELFLPCKAKNSTFSEHIDSPDIGTIVNSVDKNYAETSLQGINRLKPKDDREKHSTTLEDEILFSSDEENYEHKELQDLPFTCALETSFYDQPDILDKTMYVGFQTASNKSIQVATESFSKAKNILDEVDLSCKKELSLAELVNICDSVSKSASGHVNEKSKVIQKDESLNNPVINKSGINISIDMLSSKNDDNKTAENTNLKVAIVNENTQFLESDMSKLNAVISNVSIEGNNKNKEARDTLSQSIQIKLPPKIKFEGFNTASNKIIKLSDAALARCQKVFQDIDLDELYDQNDQNDTGNFNIKIIHPEKLTKTKALKNNLNFIDKDVILTDINDEIILKEFENTEMIVRDEIKDNKNVGFKTASHKDIKISDIAAERAKCVFKDIDTDLGESDYLQESLTKLATETNNDENTKMNHVPSQIQMKNIGFKTASNKDIKISEQAILKSKNLFSDIECDIETRQDAAQTTESNKLYSEDLVKPSTSMGFTGFQTASHKQISISKEALLKTKTIFKNIDNENSGNKTVIQDKTVNKEVKELEDNFISYNDEIPGSINKKEGDIALNTNFVGFQTASNKPVHVSAKALERSKKLFQEDIPVDFYPEKPDITNPYQTKVGFQTASNKPVHISSRSLEKGKKIFQEITDSKEHIAIPENSSTSNIGFQSASNNKQLRIPAKAMETNKKVCRDEFLELNTNSKPFKSAKIINKKPVNLPKKALERTKKIFQNLDIQETNTFDFDSRNNSPLAFKPNNNKEVKLSEQASPKNGHFFTDFNKTDNSGSSTESPFKGFQTANNKSLKVSKEAMEKCKNIFRDIDYSIDIDAQNTNFCKSKGFDIEFPKSDAMCGFKTAGNKPVCISADALARCKRLFDDIDSTANISNRNSKKEVYPGISHYSDDNKICDTHFKENMKVDFGGFKTASNKKVNTSEQALAKSKQLFQDIDVLKHKGDEKHHIVDNIDHADYKSEAKRFKADLDDIRSSTAKDASNINKENIADIINTQVLNNFEETLYTEDFREETTRNKRSGSPILSCPRAKRRRFETPSKARNTENNITTIEVTVNNKDTDIFDEFYKKSKIYKLKDLRSDDKPIDQYLSKFSFNELLNVQFEGERNDINKIKIDMENLKDLFLSSVNKKLVPNGWLDNHIKLIIWKLISYEIRFFKSLGMVCSARNVLNQLKYRYDKELYNAERPALRKILEKDDVPSKTMVLCVVAVLADGAEVDLVPTTTNNVELLLTDGWYCVLTTIDKMLTRLVREKKIVVGSKIVTNGAELVNCEQGVAPWEDTSSIRLKIFGNSTRRARWDARLGYHGNGAILSHLSHVKLDGGKVTRLRLFVTRVYPQLYVEKFDDGSTVTRSERLEHLYQVKYEADRQSILEKIYEEIEREFSDLDSQDADSSWDSNKKSLQTGSQIFEALRRSKDPSDLKNQLTSSQSKLLEAHASKRREKLMEKVQARLMEKLDGCGLKQARNVVTVLKARVVGIQGGEVTKGMLSIWKPNDSILELIKEDKWIEVINVVPTAVRYSEIQLSAGRQSIFIQSKYKENDTKLIDPLKRKCYHIKELNTTTNYNEADTVGIIFSIEPSMQNFDTKSHFQNVYLTDKERNIICVNFWGGLQKFGFQNVLDTGQVVACINLQKRAGNTRNILQYRATEFTYFTKSPKNFEAKIILDELDKISVLDRRKIIDECIKLKESFSVKSNENITPYRMNVDLSKKGFLDSAEKNVQAEFNLTGLDFESSFRQKDELSPKTLKRKQEVNNRIKKLKMYGEPPPLSPIHIINKSKNALNSYKSPMSNDVSLSVASNKKNDIGRNVENIPILRQDCKAENKGSPVTSLNKTYVRNSVNPVKLDFDKTSESIDQFPDEFEVSPPLSLD